MLGECNGKDFIKQRTKRYPNQLQECPRKCGRFWQADLQISVSKRALKKKIYYTIYFNIEDRQKVWYLFEKKWIWDLLSVLFRTERKISLLINSRLK